MLENTSQAQCLWGSKKVNFQSLVKDGELYEFIQENFQGKYIERKLPKLDRFKDRKATKGEVLFMLYHNPKDSRKSARIKQPFHEFIKLFPAQGNVLNLLKSRDYKDAPKMLQRVESYLFLEKIAKPLLKEGIPVLTIHDSIVVHEKYADKAMSLMKSILFEHIGEEPSIKLEKWGE
jgi:hypothetical protein